MATKAKAGSGKAKAPARKRASRAKASERPTSEAFERGKKAFREVMAAYQRGQIRKQDLQSRLAAAMPKPKKAKPTDAAYQAAAQDQMRKVRPMIGVEAVDPRKAARPSAIPRLTERERWAKEFPNDAPIGLREVAPTTTKATLPLLVERAAAAADEAGGHVGRLHRLLETLGVQHQYPDTDILLPPSVKPAAPPLLERLEESSDLLARHQNRTSVLLNALLDALT